jgi:HEPN domain-containing protein/predicted nucleotidyltransferase
MLADLNAVLERLVAGYNPDRIILFGSHAVGRARDVSDVDLLIVKDTEHDPLARRIEVERLLSDRRIPLDLFVYTPKELWQLFAAGSPFIEEVFETGRVLYMRKTTDAWLAEAEDEFESASILLDNHKYRAACLHSQQCVEKALKALILEKGRRPSRTHDIVDLLNGVRMDGWPVALEMDEAVYLNSVYRGRYPTEEGLLPHGEASREDAGRALKAAETIMYQVKTALSSS